MADRHELRVLAGLAIGLILLPWILSMAGLTYSTAVECVALAMAGLALNVLLGYTGLVSFGHGAWFGLGGYAVGILQLRYFQQSSLIPLVLALVLVAATAVVIGFLILRRRGVYFSLLTLAFAALCFSVAYRWTSLTGGENGLGGIERRSLIGLDLDDSLFFYAFVAIVGWCVAASLLRLAHSPLGHVLTAIRENELRTRFIGFNALRYKLVAFVISAAVTALAGGITVLNHRIASAESMSLVFSGELLAITLIGGMRSFTGPIYGALFFILFREYLSIYTDDWLLWFGLVFIAFILLSPQGLAGLGLRLRHWLRPPPAVQAAMHGRSTSGAAAVPPFLCKDAPAELVCRGISVQFGGVRAVDGVDIVVAGRGIHALIGPNGAGKTTLFNLVSGMFAPQTGSVTLGGTAMPPARPDHVCAMGLARSFQITNLFKGLSVRQNLCLAVLSRDPRRYSIFRRLDSLADTQAQTDALVDYLGVRGMDAALAEDLSYGGQRLVDMGLALGTAPRMLLLDEPLAGLAAAERDRITALIRDLSQCMGVLVVEHDMDRVFGMAGVITVMDQGRVLLEGTPQLVRDDPKVREVYIGSGAGALIASAETLPLAADTLLQAESVDAFYGKSHILSGITFGVRQGEVLAVLGRLRRRHPSEPGWTDEQIFQLFPRLRDRHDVDASMLSGGEQQMVAIARALAGHVRILLLDEPFEGLSPAMTEEVFNAVLRLRRKLTVLIVDHDLDLALALADTALVLDRGRITHWGPARPLLVDLPFRRQKLWL